MGVEVWQGLRMPSLGSVTDWDTDKEQCPEGHLQNLTLHGKRTWKGRKSTCQLRRTPGRWPSLVQGSERLRNSEGKP